MVVGIIMDQNGRPVCSEMWPGIIATDCVNALPSAGSAWWLTVA
jgi:hypothetical protein